MQGRWRIYVTVTKEMMKSGEALVGMKRRGSQLESVVVRFLSKIVNLLRLSSGHTS